MAAIKGLAAGQCLYTHGQDDRLKILSTIDPDIDWYYRQGREQNRLSDFCQLEEFRTRQIISRRLKLDETAQSIVDIGGGAGAYAIWLSDMGHTVSLVEPIALHLEQAAGTMDPSAPLSDLIEADARDLPFDDGVFDVALSLGPLYHFTERTDRITSLREAWRVLRPGGKLFAGAISRYGMIVEGFFKGYMEKPEYAEIMRSNLESGEHRNPARTPGLFTTAYFHKPEELRTEVEDSGFATIELRAIEGPGGCIPDFKEKWRDESFRSFLVETIERMESDPSIIGFGGHLMAVATKPLG